MYHDKMKTLDLLIQVGLSEREATIYEALLDMESVSIRKVADKTGINRGTTYEAIKSLQSIGLVHVRRSGEREYFSAETPEKILDILRDRRKELLRTQQLASELIPELLAEKARPTGRPLVRYFEDDEGVVAILKDVLSTCSKMKTPLYRVYSSKNMRSYIYRKFPNFTDRRVEEGIVVKVIAIGEGGDKAPASERKWLPEEGTSISSYTIVYDNKIAQISIAKDFTPYGVVIEDEGTANMQRQLFDQLWSKI
jgi:sugar-specific transcriptional regulator TrmB